MRTKLAFVLVLCAVASAQQATAPKAPKDESLYISESKLQSIMQSAAGSFSSRLFDGGSYSTAFIRLTAPDQPHAHGIWSEVFVIKEGSAILETGGTIIGDITGDSAVHRAIFVDGAGKAQPQPEPAKPAAARRVVPGDKSGTAIEGGRKQRVQAGDVILGPAGVAHTFIQVDQPVVYLDIKFPKAE